MKKITTAGSEGCEEVRKRETVFHQCMLPYHTESNEYIVIKVMQEPTYPTPLEICSWALLLPPLLATALTLQRG